MRTLALVIFAVTVSISGLQAERFVPYWPGPPLQSTEAQARWIVRRVTKACGLLAWRERTKDLIYQLDTVLKDETGKVLKERTDRFFHLRRAPGGLKSLSRILEKSSQGLRVVAFDGHSFWSSLDGRPNERDDLDLLARQLMETAFWQLMPFRLEWSDIKVDYLGLAPIDRLWCYQVLVTPTGPAMVGDRLVFHFHPRTWLPVKVLLWKRGQPRWAPIEVWFSNWVETCGIHKARCITFVNLEKRSREVHLERLLYNSGQALRLYLPPAVATGRQSPPSGPPEGGTPCPPVVYW